MNHIFPTYTYVSYLSLPQLEDTSRDSLSADFHHLQRLMDEHSYADAITMLLSLFSLVSSESEAIQSYQFLFRLLPHFQSLDLLENNLSRLFRRFPSLPQYQLECALQLGTYYQNQNNYVDAMHAFAKAIQINYDRQVHRIASRLFARILSRKLAEFLQNPRPSAETLQSSLAEISTFRSFCLCQQDLQPFYTRALDRTNHVLFEEQDKEPWPSLRTKINKQAKAFQEPDILATERYQTALHAFRNSFSYPIHDVREFQRHVTRQFLEMFKIFLHDAFILLGKPPCAYDMRAMGSLGKEEICNFSDLEYFILIEDIQHKTYFKELAKILEIQIASLGETQRFPLFFTCLKKPNPTGLRIDNSPAQEGGDLIHTPQTMAWLQRNPIVGPNEPAYMSLSTISLVERSLENPDSPDSAIPRKSLDSEYKDLAKMEGRLQKRALWSFKNSKKLFQEYWKQPFHPNSTIKIKDQYVRLLNYLLCDIALFYGLIETNTLDIIDALVHARPITPFAHESILLLKESVSLIYKIRIRLHGRYQQPNEEASCIPHLSLETLTSKETFALEKCYWLVLLPLYRCLGKVSSPEDFYTVFQNIDFIQESIQNFCTSFQNTKEKSYEPFITHIAAHFCETKAPLRTHLEFYQTLSKMEEKGLRRCYIETIRKELGNTPLLKQLLHIPNRAGFRLAFEDNFEDLKKQIEKITEKDSSQILGGQEVLLKMPGVLLPRYLKPSLIKGLLDENGNIHKKYTDSAHNVCFLKNENYDLHFKQKPSHPLMEYAIHNLTCRIAGNVTPPTILVNLITPGKNYPVLISKTIPGSNLSSVYQSVQPNASSYTWNLLCSILTRPGDGRLANYIIDEHGNLFCVDNDCSFVELVDEGYFSSKVNFCAAPFSMRSNRHLDAQVLKEFAALNPQAILLDWIDNVIYKEAEYIALFPEEDRSKFFTEDKKNMFTPTILFKEGAVANLYLQFWSLQNRIAQALVRKETLTAEDLLKELISINNESFGLVVHKAYSNPKTSDAKEGLKQATSRKTEQSLPSIQYHEAMGIDPTFEKIEKEKSYSPEKAKSELLCLISENKGIYATVRENQNTILIQGHFKYLENDPARERKVLLVLLQKFKKIPKDRKVSLIFHDSHIITSDLLAPFLNDNVEIIELNYCQTVKDKYINLIQEKCKQLKRLSLKGCKGITTISDYFLDPFFPDPLLNFAKLKELDVSDCTYLQSLKLDAPLLETLRFKNTPNLQVFENKKILLMAIKQNIEAFRYANAILKQDKEVVLAAVKQNGWALFYADESLKKDKEFVLTAVTQDERALQFVDESLKKDKDFILGVVTQNGWALQFADESLKQDREVVLAAVTQYGLPFEYADESLKKDREVVLAAVTQNGSALQFADESLKKDRNFVLAAVTQNGRALQYAYESLKKDRGFVLDAVTQNGLALEYADKSLKKDKEVVLAAVTQNSSALEYADDSLKKDKKFVLTAVTQNGRALFYADEGLKKDKEVVLAAVTQDDWALDFADESLKEDKEFVLAAVTQQGWALLYADESLKQDKEVVLAAVKESGWALQYADESLKKDKEVVLAAVKESGWALQYAYESLKKDRGFVLDAVTQNGLALEYADKSLKKDKEVVLAAVKQDGQALYYADESLKQDKEVVLAAVKHDGLALDHADESLKKDRDFILSAVTQDGWALACADESLQKDKEVVLAAVKQHGDALQYADESLKKDEEFVLAAVTKDGLALQYADESLKKDKEIVLAAVKQNGRALQYADESLEKDKEVVLTAVKQNGMALLYVPYSIKNEVVQEMKETNEKLTRAFVQFSLGFNDQNSSLKDLPKEAIHNILIYGKSQLFQI